MEIFDESSLNSSASTSNTNKPSSSRTNENVHLNSPDSSPLLPQSSEESTSELSIQNTATNLNSTNHPQINFDMAHFDRTLVVIVHFLIVVAESLRHCSPEETYKLKKLVYELIKLNPKNSKNSTLLHLASSRDSSSIIKNHTLSSFPSTEVLKLLLECGADPNSLDGERNSPLHLAASNRNSPLTSNNSNPLSVAGQPASVNGGVGLGVVVVANIGMINNLIFLNQPSVKILICNQLSTATKKFTLFQPNPGLNFWVASQSDCNSYKIFSL